MVELNRQNATMKRAEQEGGGLQRGRSPGGSQRPRSLGRHSLKLENMVMESGQLSAIQHRPNRDRFDPEVYDQQEEELVGLRQALDNARAAKMAQNIQFNKLPDEGQEPIVQGENEDPEEGEPKGESAAVLLFGETFDQNFTVNEHDYNEKHKEKLAAMQPAKAEPEPVTAHHHGPTDDPVQALADAEAAAGAAQILETWLNQTLNEAETLEIPGVLIKPTHKLPLARYGIERDRLVSSQISVADVDRIYRSLFVYSVGFYEMLNKCVGHTRYRYSIVS